MPSGPNVTTGEAFAATVRATATLSLELLKSGKIPSAAAPYQGELWLADIGVPEAAYGAVGLKVGPIFATEELIRVK